jgi:hypothetical protein
LKPAAPAYRVAGVFHGVDCDADPTGIRRRAIYLPVSTAIKIVGVDADRASLWSSGLPCSTGRTA